MLTVSEAAAYLTISEREMYNLASPNGPIPCYRFGPRMTRFEISDLEAFKTSSKVTEATIACGVYMLLRKKAIVYVGKSLNIQRRIGQHAERRLIDFDAYRAIPCRQEEMDVRERELIAEHQPEHNVHYKVPCS